MARLLIILLLLPLTSLAQIPTQTLRGKVTDGLTQQALQGATVVLLGLEPAIGEVTDVNGNFTLEKIPVGRYSLQVNYLGYETLIIAEILLESGRETIQNIRLSEQAEDLGEVTVKAQGPGNLDGHPVSLHTLTTDELFRYPATFFDPARVATAYPGVVSTNDQSNHLSIRGNSPSSLRWRLEGVDIVNPNHTANAGTFGDRPSSAGGGVSILSAQVLSASNFLTGAFPSGYGNALGGVMDMRFRKGNDQRRQYVLQAGLIGLEAAVEGPFSSRQSTDGSPQSGASYLVNYRYSFTGLLTGFGVDFGGEEIGFQDLSFHLNFPTKKAGEIGIFGLGGKSKNIFKSPLDSDKIEVEKDLYDIDFNSKMGAIGITHTLPIGKHSVLRSVAAVSALEHQRTENWVALISTPFLTGDDELNEQKFSFSTVFSQKISSRSQCRIGFQATKEDANFYHNTRNSFGDSLAMQNGEVNGLLWQPFIEWQSRLSERWEIVAGLHLTQFDFIESIVLEPRASVQFFLNEKAQLSLAYGLHSQTQIPDIYNSSNAIETIGFTRAHHLVFGYQQKLRAAWRLNAELYYQRLFDVPETWMQSNNRSLINFRDYSELRGRYFNRGSGRNFGLDLSMQKYWNKGRFALLSGSLFRSLFAIPGGERPTIWDARYLLSLSVGKEKLKEKKGKAKVWGSAPRLVWMGGLPEDTSYKSDRLKDYFRIDWRFYLKWERPNRSSMLSLDIQNATNRKNEAYRYFDQVQGKSVIQEQLGFIPVLSWRLEFE